MTLDEIYDTYVDFNDDLELDINTCNMLIRKTICEKYIVKFFIMKASRNFSNPVLPIGSIFG